MESWLLTILVFLPLVGIPAILLLDGRRAHLSRHVALFVSLATLGVMVSVVAVFAGRAWGSSLFVLEHRADLIGASGAPAFELSYHVAVDGISLWLLVLTALLSSLAIWGSYSGIREHLRGYYSLMLLLETAMLGVFCARDLLLFYMFFDLTLVPLFFIIGIWGGADRRYAAYKFFLYTLAGSVLMLGSILYLAWRSYQVEQVLSFDVERLFRVVGHLSLREQEWLLLAFFAAFAIKVPLFPLHTWLPLAHTEAPTAGSVILAGVLLKLGTYGFLRFTVPFFPQAVLLYAPLLAALAIAGILYGALVAWAQHDFKKLIAYSSVSHLGFCMLGLFSLKMAGLTGSLLYMVNHGLSTGALFFVVGMVYERYHTRDMYEIGGLAYRMPRLAFFMVFFALASVALPGLNGFVSEFLVLLGTFVSNTTMDGLPAGPLDWRYAVVAAAGVVLGAVYMFWWLRRVLFGPVVEPPHTPDTSHVTLDLTPREMSILGVLAAACLLLGVYPKPLLSSMAPALADSVLAQVYERRLLLPPSGPIFGEVDTNEGRSAAVRLNAGDATAKGSPADVGTNDRPPAADRWHPRPLVAGAVVAGAMPVARSTR